MPLLLIAGSTSASPVLPTAIVEPVAADPTHAQASSDDLAYRWIEARDAADSHARPRSWRRCSPWPPSIRGRAS